MDVFHKQPLLPPHTRADPGPDPASSAPPSRPSEKASASPGGEEKLAELGSGFTRKVE